MYPTCQRLPQARNKVQRAAAGSRRHDSYSGPEAGAHSGSAAAVSVGHRGGRKLVLGQHRGHVRPEVRRVVEILDVGTVHTEDVVDSDFREVLDDVIDHPVLSGHLLT